MGGAASGVFISTFDAIFRHQLIHNMNGQCRLLKNGEYENLVLRAIKLSGRKLKQDRAKEYIAEFASYTEIPASLAKKQAAGYDVFQAYEKLRRERGAWDFAAITRAVVKAQEAGKIELMDFTRIIVDEFQDTNDLQYRWLRAYRNQARVLVVGDDDQSIYGWRHSKGMENFNSFIADFSAISVTLNICYRCKPRILKAADRLIRNNTKRLEKDMQSYAEYGGHVDVRMLGSDEVVDIAEHIASLHPKERTKWAVLARTNLQLRSLAAELSQLGVDYVSKDKDALFSRLMADILYRIFKIYRYSQTEHIKDVLSWLGECEYVLEESNWLKKRSILYSFSVDDNKASLSKTDQFLWLINQWNHSEPETLKAMNTLLNFFGNVRGLNRREIGEFQALSGIVQSFTHASSFKEVAQIYCSMYEKVGQNQDADEADKLELLTLHSSKGLQWPSVWIMSVNEEVLPSANNSNIEEERRLLFVGMTRAEEKLVISYQDDKKSLFIDEL